MTLANHTFCLAAAITTVSVCAFDSKAQTGTLDQSSPMDPAASTAAVFTVSATLPFQQQIVAGRSGLLTGIRINLYGPVGSGMRLRVRMGSTWSQQPVLFDTLVTKTVSGYQSVWIDMSGANILLSAGTRFVMETFAVAGVTPGRLVGSYKAPTTGSPLYPFPLYFAGIPFTDGGWRHGFQTFLQTDLCAADINSDGGIDGLDVSDFFNAWENGAVQADVNLDGGIDGTDVSDFIDAWIQASC